MVRRRRARPRCRWEDVWVRAAGVDWLHRIAGAGRLDVVAGFANRNPGNDGSAARITEVADKFTEPGRQGIF